MTKKTKKRFSCFLYVHLFHYVLKLTLNASKGIDSNNCNVHLKYSESLFLSRGMHYFTLYNTELEGVAILPKGGNNHLSTTDDWMHKKSSPCRNVPEP